jgi:hypothetical protein
MNYKVHFQYAAGKQNVGRFPEIIHLTFFCLKKNIEISFVANRGKVFMFCFVLFCSRMFFFSFRVRLAVEVQGVPRRALYPFVVAAGRPSQGSTVASARRGAAL